MASSCPYRRCDRTKRSAAYGKEFAGIARELNDEPCQKSAKKKANKPVVGSKNVVVIALHLLVRAAIDKEHRNHYNIAGEAVPLHTSRPRRLSTSPVPPNKYRIGMERGHS